MVEQVLGVLSEAFEGPQETWSYFTDSGRDGGLFGTLERLDAEVASRVLGRTTIAAHVNHVTFGLHASARWIEGDRTTHKWDESWSVSSVDGEEWVRAKEAAHRIQGHTARRGDLCDGKRRGHGRGSGRPGPRGVPSRGNPTESLLHRGRGLSRGLRLC